MTAAVVSKRLAEGLVNHLAQRREDIKGAREAWRSAEAEASAARERAADALDAAHAAQLNHDVREEELTGHAAELQAAAQRAGYAARRARGPLVDAVGEAETAAMRAGEKALRMSPEDSARVERMGFILKPMKLCAADYGVPQTRWRAVILGLRDGDPAAFFPPLKTHFNPNNGAKSSGGYADDARPWATVRDAIEDLPKPVGTEIRDVPPPDNLHFGRTPTQMSLRRYRAVAKQGMNRFDLQRLAPELTPGCWIRKTSGGTDLFGRLWWDRPAFTIRTEFYKPEKGRYLHPVQHRPITHREAARFQSFPDEFVFTGTKIEIAKQIGNAVPPLLAQRVAECVTRALAPARR